MLETYKVRAVNKETNKKRDITVSFLLSENDVIKLLNNDRGITAEEYDIKIKKLGNFKEKDGMYEYSKQVKEEEPFIEGVYSKLIKKYYELNIVN